MTPHPLRWVLIGCLLSASGAVWAEEPATPPEPQPHPPAQEAKPAPLPEAQLNDLVAEYTIRYQFDTVAKAIPVAERALALAEQILGPNDPRVAQVLNDLGFFHQKQNEPDKAQPLHERALKIREAAFKGEGAEVVQSLVNLAKVHAAKTRYSRAQPLFERALVIAEKNVPPTDRFLLRILEPYAETLQARRNAKAAEQITIRIRNIRAAQSGAAAPSINEILH